MPTSDSVSSLVTVNNRMSPSDSVSPLVTVNNRMSPNDSVSPMVAVNNRMSPNDSNSLVFFGSSLWSSRTHDASAWVNECVQAWPGR